MSSNTTNIAKLMRLFKQHILKTVVCGVILFVSACDTDVQKPILSDDSKFTAPRTDKRIKHFNN